MAEGQVIVGLEVHCQLDTKSKLFCGCSTDYRNDGPNTHVCPVCLGLPGTMPLLNKRSIEYAMKVAKALNCTVLAESEFSRKNYFYPDLDKAYQITQYDKPLAEGGYLERESDEGGEKRIHHSRPCRGGPRRSYTGSGTGQVLAGRLQPGRYPAHRNRE
jgi:aspartyl-tRNA(Asn)/glutamyl-tRNA(Gln) amidotransferase subunit B